MELLNFTKEKMTMFFLSFFQTIEIKPAHGFTKIVFFYFSDLYKHNITFREVSFVKVFNRNLGMGLI